MGWLRRSNRGTQSSSSPANHRQPHHNPSHPPKTLEIAQKRTNSGDKEDHAKANTANKSRSNGNKNKNKRQPQQLQVKPVDAVNLHPFPTEDALLYNSFNPSDSSHSFNPFDDSPTSRTTTTTTTTCSRRRKATNTTNATTKQKSPLELTTELAVLDAQVTSAKRQLELLRMEGREQRDDHQLEVHLLNQCYQVRYGTYLAMVKKAKKHSQPFSSYTEIVKTVFSYEIAASYLDNNSSESEFSLGLGDPDKNPEYADKKPLSFKSSTKHTPGAYLEGYAVRAMHASTLLQKQTTLASDDKNKLIADIYYSSITKYKEDTEAFIASLVALNSCSIKLYRTAIKERLRLQESLIETLQRQQLQKSGLILLEPPTGASSSKSDKRSKKSRKNRKRKKGKKGRSSSKKDASSSVTTRIRSKSTPSKRAVYELDGMDEEADDISAASAGEILQPDENPASFDEREDDEDYHRSIHSFAQLNVCKHEEQCQENTTIIMTSMGNILEPLPSLENDDDAGSTPKRRLHNSTSCLSKYHLQELEEQRQDELSRSSSHGRHGKRSVASTTSKCKRRYSRECRHRRGRSTSRRNYTSPDGSSLLPLSKRSSHSPSNRSRSRSNSRASHQSLSSSRHSQQQPHDYRNITKAKQIQQQHHHQQQQQQQHNHRPRSLSNPRSPANTTSIYPSSSSGSSSKITTASIRADCSFDSQSDHSHPPRGSSSSLKQTTRSRSITQTKLCQNRQLSLQQQEKEDSTPFQQPYLVESNQPKQQQRRGRSLTSSQRDCSSHHHHKQHQSNDPSLTPSNYRKGNRRNANLSREPPVSRGGEGGGEMSFSISPKVPVRTRPMIATATTITSTPSTRSKAFVASSPSNGLGALTLADLSLYTPNKTFSHDDDGHGGDYGEHGMGPMADNPSTSFLPGIPLMQ